MFAQKQIPITYSKLTEKELLRDLVFIGLIGIKDPWRKEVQGALKICSDCKLNVCLITGDTLCITNSQNEIISNENDDDDQ